MRSLFQGARSLPPWSLPLFFWSVVPGGMTERKAKAEAMSRKRNAMYSFANQFGLPPRQ